MSADNFSVHTNSHPDTVAFTAIYVRDPDNPFNQSSQCPRQAL